MCPIHCSEYTIRITYTLNFFLLHVLLEQIRHEIRSPLFPPDNEGSTDVSTPVDLSSPNTLIKISRTPRVRLIHIPTRMCIHRDASVLC